MTDYYLTLTIWQRYEVYRAYCRSIHAPYLDYNKWLGA